jgi:hypothetical protein
MDIIVTEIAPITFDLSSGTTTRLGSANVFRIQQWILTFY